MRISEEKINELLAGNVNEIVDKEHLKRVLHSGKKLRIKLGIDPTGPRIHLGRAVALWKLKEFQDLGHQIVLIVGDFTGLVGDASDKKSGRSMLTEEQVKKNMADYPKQIGKILDVKKVEFRQNSEWLSRLTMKDIIRLSSLFTVHQMIDRRNFKERFEKGQQIGLHEFLYPLLQGYDSVATHADVELGGTDQLFNLKAGRKIQEFYGQEPQDILLLEMLPGLDGQKMSTTSGNIINIGDEPKDMYGKIMSMKDELIAEYFLRCTNVPDEKISEIKKGLENKTFDPLREKSYLASEIVKLYHGDVSAKTAAEHFRKTFQEKESPDDAQKIKVKKGEELADVLIISGIVSSKSEFRRLVREKAIEADGAVLNNSHYVIVKTSVIKVGKRRFLKIII